MSAKKSTSTTITTSDEARINMATYAQLLESRWLNRATKLRPLMMTGHMGIGKSQMEKLFLLIRTFCRLPVTEFCSLTS